MNVNEPWELRYWSEKFNVSHDRLKEAVKKVGVSAAKVQEYLND